MNLPDTTTWVPKSEHIDWLKAAYIQQCIYSEELIKSRLALERKTKLNTFDIGLPLEELILQELSKLFPKRYLFTNGVVSDSIGQTAGDCDIVVFNDFWFPHAISGATNQSRKKFLPIDGVYAIGEIKSTINDVTLDDACKKLVMCSRLKRKATLNERITENREAGCIHGLTNPLYTFIIATDVDSSKSFEELINRFFDINKQLSRLEVIRSLCVFGHGMVTWGFKDDNGIGRPALFMNEDLYKPIYPVYIPYDSLIPSLYHFASNLYLHLFHSILAPEDFTRYYGTDEFNNKAPISPNIQLHPDEEWLSKLDISCSSHYNKK